MSIKWTSGVDRTDYIKKVAKPIHADYVNSSVSQQGSRKRTMVLKQGRYERPAPPKPMYTFPEKAAAAASYIPFMVGFLIGIVYILAKGPNCDRSFFRFHFYQAIFLQVLVFLIQALGSGMSGVIIGTIRLCEGLIGSGTVLFLTENLSMVTNVLMLPFLLLVPYGIIMALLGRYADIPWVSRVIRSNMAGT